jgi:hypothetical protein
MRRSLPLLVLTLAVPLFLLAQHSGGGSGSSGSGGGGASHSSGGSSSSSSYSGAASHSSSGGSSTVTHSLSATTHAGASHFEPTQPARQGTDASKRPVRVPGQPPEKNPKQDRRLFAFLSPHTVAKPPCRGKDCPASCPPGQVSTKSGSCVAALVFNSCTSYDLLGTCSSSSPFYSCSGPSAGVLAAQELEVERLRLARESACSQGPSSQACTDLTGWYNAAWSRLEELRAEARRCR